MPIIAYLGTTINEYIVKVLLFLSALEFYCPVCGEKMRRHGKYPRNIKDKKATIWIYRFKCKNKKCKKTVAVLPDFLMPYKQYSADEIEFVLLDSDVNKPEQINAEASLTTVRRWLNEYEYKMETWVSNLKTILMTRTGKAISVSQLDCRYIEQLSIILEEMSAIKSCGNILGITMIYISASTT